MGRRRWKKRLSQTEQQAIYEAIVRAKKARREARAAMHRDFEARGKPLSENFRDRVKEEAPKPKPKSGPPIPGDCPLISEP